MGSNFPCDGPTETAEGQQHRGFSGNGCPYPAPRAFEVSDVGGFFGGFFGGTVQSWAWNAWNACREMLREAGETGGLFQGLL